MAEALRPEEKLKGPHLELSTKRVAIECLRGHTGRGSVSMNNTGTTTLYYKWTRVEEDLLPGANGGMGYHRFYNSDQSGEILPGESREVVFSFRSGPPGAFREKWALSTFPETPFGEGIVEVVAAAVAEDGQELQRRNMALRLESSHRNRVVTEQLERLIADIVESEPVPLPAETDPNWAHFTASNLSSDPAIYFSEKCWGDLQALWGEITDARQRMGTGSGGEDGGPAPDATDENAMGEWDGTVRSLEASLRALEDAVGPAPAEEPSQATEVEDEAEGEGDTGGNDSGDNGGTEARAAVEEFRARFSSLVDALQLPEHRRDIVSRAACAAFLQAADQIEAAMEEQSGALSALEEAAAAAAEEAPTEEAEPGEEAGEEPAAGAGPSMAEKREEILDKTLESVFSAFVGTVGRLDGAVERDSSAVATVIAGKLRGLSDMASRENADAESILWDTFDLNRRLKHLELIEAGSK